MKTRWFLISILLVAASLLAACSVRVVEAAMPAEENPAESTPSGPSPDDPLTDTAQIIAVLEGLRQQNQELQRQPVWWHESQQLVKEAGSLHSASFSNWFHAATEAEQCVEKMYVTPSQADEGMMQYVIQLADGSFGDLVQLRQGEGQVTSVKGTEACSTLPIGEGLDSLVMFLKGENLGTTKDGRELKTARAWYDDQGAFIVDAEWTLPWNNPDHQTDTYTFDAQTGLLLHHHMQMLFSDDTSMGELEWTYEYQQLDKMPDEVAEQFQQAAEELQSYLQ
ncbi:MAG: hypothetical protein GYA59_00395 [Chloroflexi bacterium]|nr:hypothetical protein [Chloroflexota bacterium]